MESPRPKKTPILPFALITSLFLMWGLAANMTDTLLAAFKRIMSMTDFQTSWIQMAFYGSYFFLAFPAALFIKKFTFKAGILLGLGMYAVGALLFYPASLTMNYAHFLVSLFILAGGLAILETTANPYILVLGPEKTATRRLNFAQSFNPIGAIAGVLLSKVFILSSLNRAGDDERASLTPGQLEAIQSHELEAVMGPYVGVAFLLILLWITIAMVKMPKASDSGSEIHLMPTIKRLFRNPNYLLGVFTMFIYVGAQIGIWSFTIRYVMKELNLYEADSSDYYLASLVLFTVSRFITTGLMKFINAEKLLTGFSVLAMILVLIVINGKGYTGVYALIGISGCMSLMFPTIYGLAMQGLGDDTKVGGSGLVMGIAGGAILTAIQGQVSDAMQSINLAFYVPFACFGVVALYGLISRKLLFK